MSSPADFQQTKYTFAGKINPVVEYDVKKSECGLCSDCVGFVGPRQYDSTYTVVNWSMLQDCHTFSSM